MTAALVSAPALGDGLLGMVLAHNLHCADRPAVVFHTALSELAAWFPWARIEPRPPTSELRERVAAADALFLGDVALVVALGTLPATRVVFGKDRWVRNHPYLHSLRTACEEALALPAWRDDPGLVVPHAAADVPVKGRVVLHPFSARPAKDWPVRRWVALAERLRASGRSPVVLLAPPEVEAWTQAAGDAVETSVPGALGDVAAWLRTAEGVIATDSGIAHLASALGVPTLAIFRKASAARFWAPAWGRTAVVTAPLRLPGGQGHRLWTRFLGPGRVLGAYEALVPL